ncbi:MAG: hypothetical protein ACRDRU_30245 [Pseudonocardiaceae bacterium]
MELMLGERHRRMRGAVVYDHLGSAGNALMWLRDYHCGGLRLHATLTTPGRVRTATLFEDRL